MRNGKGQLAVRLPQQAIDKIDELIGVGIYGDNRGEVLRSLVLDQIKRLIDARVITPPTSSSVAHLQQSRS